MKKKSTFYSLETQGHYIRLFLDCVQDEFMKLNEKGKIPHGHRYNLSKNERKALKQFSDNDDIVVCQPDRGVGTVVQNDNDYNAETIKILSDKNYYKKVEVDPFFQIENKFSIFLKTACDNGTITKEFRFIYHPISK